jgi:hypothetical protein
MCHPQLKLQKRTMLGLGSKRFVSEWKKKKKNKGFCLSIAERENPLF